MSRSSVESTLKSCTRTTKSCSFTLPKRTRLFEKLEKFLDYDFENAYEANEDIRHEYLNLIEMMEEAQLPTCIFYCNCYLQNLVFEVQRKEKSLRKNFYLLQKLDKIDHGDAMYCENLRQETRDFTKFEFRKKVFQFTSFWAYRTEQLASLWPLRYSRIDSRTGLGIRKFYHRLMEAAPNKTMFSLFCFESDFVQLAGQVVETDLGSLRPLIRDELERIRKLPNGTSEIQFTCPKKLPLDLEIFDRIKNPLQYYTAFVKTMLQLVTNACYDVCFRIQSERKMLREQLRSTTSQVRYMSEQTSKEILANFKSFESDVLRKKEIHLSDIRFLQRAVIQLTQALEYTAKEPGVVDEKVEEIREMLMKKREVEKNFPQILDIYLTALHDCDEDYKFYIRQIEDLEDTRESLNRKRQKEIAKKQERLESLQLERSNYARQHLTKQSLEIVELTQKINEAKSKNRATHQKEIDELTLKKSQLKEKNQDNEPKRRVYEVLSQKYRKKRVEISQMKRHLKTLDRSLRTLKDDFVREELRLSAEREMLLRSEPLSGSLHSLVVHKYFDQKCLEFIHKALEMRDIPAESVFNVCAQLELSLSKSVFDSIVLKTFQLHLVKRKLLPESHKLFETCNISTEIPNAIVEEITQTVTETITFDSSTSEEEMED